MPRGKKASDFKLAKFLKLQSRSLEYVAELRYKPGFGCLILANEDQNKVFAKESGITDLQASRNINGVTGSWSVKIYR